MTSRADVIHAAADRLADAERHRRPIPPLVDDGLTIDEAYQVQLANVERRLRQGDRITGKKIGLTSRVVQEALGVAEPDYGHLFASLEAGPRVSIDALVAPRVEGEVAFVLNADLPTSGVDADAVLAATACVVASIEIVDSRIEDWNITIVDTVADNASAGGYVLGTERFAPGEVDLAAVRMELLKNHEVVNAGLGSAVLGHPAASVAWLANAIGAYGIQLHAGEVILSGALSGMVDVARGDHIEARYDALGSVEVSFA